MIVIAELSQDLTELDETFDFWVKIFGFLSELKKGGGWPHTQPPNAGFHPKPDSRSLGIFTVRKRFFTMLGIEAFWVKFLDETFDF